MFASKNISISSNTKYSIAMILVILMTASCGGHTINSKAISPNADTVFYRISTTIRQLENQLCRQGLEFIRERKNKLNKLKCYIVIDETYDSYTGRLLRKAKYLKCRLTKNDKFALKYIHEYKPNKGDTGSYKYLAIAMVYGNKRRVLRIKAIKKKERYKDFIIKTLLEIKKEINYECALFDRGFYDGKFVENLKANNIPFIIRARISDTMKKIYGFYFRWKCYKDFEIGQSKSKGDLVLGADQTGAKRTKWAFITNLEFDNWHNVRIIYKKRWNIENIFKATDGIQLKMETNNPINRLFGVCLSFLLYNSWQNKKKRRGITLLNFVMKGLETLFDKISKTVEFYRDKLKINIPFWDKIVSSF